MKDSVITEYKKKLHKIWKSLLNLQHKVNATNTLAISLQRYWFVTMKWARRELRDLDVLTWKVLRRYQSHHLNACPREVVSGPRTRRQGAHELPADLGVGGGELRSLPRVHPRSNHGCDVQVPTAVGRKELLQFVTISKQDPSRGWM